MHIQHIKNIQGLLTEIPDPPKELYIEGNQQLLHSKTHIYVCIIGPRKASSYGTDVTKYLINHMKNMHIITVSGAAYGIDSVVHTHSIGCGIPTIAIPGSGIDDEVFYPRAHLSLKHMILEHGGLIVNEFTPLSRASPWSFPVRNRLMAGMSHVTIVIEAEQSSGTLITAHLATDYGREVIAIPGSIYSSTSRGTHTLISKGATICEGLHTLTEVLTNIAKIRNIELWKNITLAEEYTASEESKKAHTISLNEQEQKVYDCIQSFASGISKEDISKALIMTSMNVSIYVTILELHGLVKTSLGKVCVKR